jgi:hypothetical protein
MWGLPDLKKDIPDALRAAPIAFVHGIADIFIKPPQKLISMWEGLSPEDQKLFAEAALAGARIAAKMLIKKGGKVEF